MRLRSGEGIGWLAAGTSLSSFIGILGVFGSDSLLLRNSSENFTQHIIVIFVSLLFLTFNVLVPNPEKLLDTVANPARGLLNREKITHAARSDKIKIIPCRTAATLL